MKKSIKRPVLTAEALEQLRLPRAEVRRTTLLDTVITAGSMQAIRMLHEEQELLCGPRHAQSEDRQAYRHGTSAGSLVLGGRRVTMPRPRARSFDGREMVLPTWKQWSDE